MPLTTIDPPTIQGFEVFAPIPGASPNYLIRWRYLAYNGLVPVEIWVETTTAVEMTGQADLQSDADAAASAAYEAAGYTY